ncbi:lipase family protein [Amycolatopsis sp. cmx-11-51]|uniref:lipase family protein n=1 Tax=Amycolatopsis sp. cmx-11-51 TaxID=2785797 RepID=UPI0039E56F89
MTRWVKSAAALSMLPLLWAAAPVAADAAQPVRTAIEAGVPLPDDDPFYVPPAGFENSPNGTVLRSRPVNTVAIVLPITATAHQVLYKSVDSHDKPVAEAATVLIPLTPWKGAGPRPLVSYQLAEDSLATRCQPSYTLRVGIAAPTAASTYEITQSLAALARNYAVVYSDYEGPHSDFAAGPQAAHGVLDGIRAVQHYAPAGLDPAGPVALWGYSGGGQATTWAAEQQASYAPELNVVGASAGGVPVDLKAFIKHNDGGLGAGLNLIGFIGLARAFPEAGIAPLLNERGRALFAASNDSCTLDVALAHPFSHLGDYTTILNPADSAPAELLYRINDLGKTTPRFPFYSYHGQNDEFVPLAPADAVVRKYCADGGTVAVSRIPFSGHLTTEFINSGPALDFLTDRFAGKPARSDCGKLPPG